MSHHTNPRAYQPYVARLCTTAAGITRISRKKTASRLSRVGRTSIRTGWSGGWVSVNGG